MIIFLFVFKLNRLQHDCKGIILVYHEIYRSTPYILIEALTKYNLLHRFLAVVKGFVNCHDIAPFKFKSRFYTRVTLSLLASILLNKAVNVSSASVRAQLCYETAVAMAQPEPGDNSFEAFLNREEGKIPTIVDPTKDQEYLNVMVKPYADSTAKIISEVKKLKVCNGHVLVVLCVLMIDSL